MWEALWWCYEHQKLRALRLVVIKAEKACLVSFKSLMAVASKGDAEEEVERWQVGRTDWR